MWRIMFLILASFCCFFGVSGAQVEGTCQPMVFPSQQVAMGVYCAGVVDYDFFLPTGQTAFDLNTAALARVHNMSFGWLPTCQASIKKFICASIYLKCNAGEDLMDSSTWSNNNSYVDFPLPYKIPCKSQCIAARSDCSDRPLYNGLEYTCDEQYNYGNGSVDRYDQADDGRYCFTITASVTVQSNKEAYIGNSNNGVCKGYVGTHIFVPSADLMGLAPMQPPYVVQTLIESSVSSAFAALPPIISSSCYVSFKKYICSSKFLSPVETTLADILTNNGKAGYISAIKSALNSASGTYQYINSTEWMYDTTVVPSFPIHQTCTNYSSICSSFIGMATTMGQTAAIPTCDAVSPTGVQSFPKEEQIIKRVSMSGLELQVNTTPNTLSFVDYDVVLSYYTPVATGSSSVGVCKTLGITDPSIAAATLCAGIVDYEYFLPAGKTDADLNTMAIQKITNSMTSLPTTCQANIKKLMCSNVYLKCLPGVNVTNPLTFDDSLYNGINIPFQRPCLDMCLAVQSSCLGIPDVMGTGVNCSGVLDYSAGKGLTPFPTQFDQGNNYSKCTFISTEVVVQGTAEPYVYANNINGSCAAYVDGPMYIPPSNKSPLPFAPMAPPGYVQNYIEFAMQDSLKKIPPFLEPSCYQAFIKFLCTRLMMEPEEKSFNIILNDNNIPANYQAAFAAGLESKGVNSTAFLENTFYVPRYPHNSICLDYANKCKAFIALIEERRPDLVNFKPNCSQTLVNEDSGVVFRRYPVANVQSISEVTFSGLGTLQITVETNYVNVDNATLAAKPYKTQCPAGFSVPEDSDGRTSWITGTNCAINCISPLFTEEEWDKFFTATNTFIILSFVFNMMTVTAHFTISDLKDEALILTFMMLSLVNSFWGMIMITKDEEERYCSSNTNPVDYRDGLTICAVQSVINLYTLLGMVILIFLETYNWHKLRTSDTTTITMETKKKQIVAALTLPLISVIILLSGEFYGYKQNTFGCLFSNDKHKIGHWDSVMLYIPVFVLLVCSVLMMVRVWLQGHRVNPAPSSDSVDVNGKLRVHKYKLAFHTLFCIVFTILGLFASIGRFNREKSSEKLQSEVKDWVKCVFLNYKGNDLYLDICGEHADNRPSKASYMWSVLTLNAHGLFLSMIYLPAAFVAVFFGMEDKGYAVAAQEKTPSGAIATAVASDGRGLEMKPVGDVKTNL